jgi:hypothetical protein
MSSAVLWTYSRALPGNSVTCFNRTWTSSTERVALEMLEDREKLRSPAGWTERNERKRSIKWTDA